ncbi:c-type cytochrome [Ruegeria sp. SCSIO 43209]|uniref:c-type cytochrome n=1 Tax=Ruegeria sp. SCSIO 43209 TaxID=2793010 RepID=UPI00147BAA40|nr:c-type cytochrome [Ruegeria sp. SCSIO 43209]UAB88633.1 c-type cytochrome [Ruegeria sp. SCSIO 43209]
MNRILATAIAGLLALPVYAEGDAEAGKKTFNKCKSCHMIADPAGEVIVKGGKTGPNLYGIAGRTAGTEEGFRYGDSIVAAGENGLVWDEETFVAYAQDPKAFLKDYLGETSAKSKMTFKLKKGAEDVYAYIVSVSGE